MTGNGSREGVIRDIHYFVDNKRFNLNYPSPILNKDGSKKVIKPVIITRREAEANRVVASVDTGRDVAVKKSGVSKTNTVLFNENFKMIKGRSGNTFSLDYHSFYPEFSSDYITESERDQAEIQANRGMVSLMARGINLVDVHAEVEKKAGKAVYVLNKENAPQLFEIPQDFEFLTKEESNDILMGRLENIGLELWQILPENSVYRERRTVDPRIIPEDEMVYATIRMDEISDGKEVIFEQPTRGLSSRRAQSSESIPTGKTQADFEGAPSNVVFSKNRQEG